MRSLNIEVSTSPQEFKEQMQRLYDRNWKDPEMFHIYADDLICMLLEKLGYKEAVHIFDTAEKWYS